MRIVQMLTTVSYGDAVGNDAIALHKALKKAGYSTGIYAERVGTRVPSGLARNISKLPELTGEDIVIYHLSTGDELNYRLPDYNGRKVLVYHNVTPEKYYSEYSVASWELCRNGIRAARYLADKVDYCLADSAFNKQDLEHLGYKCRIDVLPILIPFDDYRKEPDREIISTYSGDGYTNILFTGRIAPNKCQEDVIAAFYQYHRHYNAKSRLFLVGNYKGMELYYNRLKRYADKLGIGDDVVFTGHIGFDDILAYYRVADLFLCMSEHEGFCVPLVESMFFDVPVVAYDSSAISDTLGGSGFLLRDKDPLEAAGVIDYILSNDKTRETILLGQRKRLQDFAHDRIEKQFLTYLEDFIGEGNER